MAYQVVVPKAVQKALNGLPRSVRLKIGERVMALSGNPRPPGAIKLKGYKDQCCIWAGKYRAIRDQ